MLNTKSFFSKLMIVIISIITLITIISTYMLYKQNYDKKLLIFNNIASKVPTLIENRMKVYDQVLLSGTAMFYSKDSVSRNDWKEFVKNLRLNKNYPGIQGIGFSLIIKPQDLDAHINSIKNEGFEDYIVKPVGKRNIYTSIIYLEPFDNRNKRAFGYDMFSEPVRNKGMVNAIRTGDYSLTGKVHLLQENGNDIQAGFLAYIPVYKPNMPRHTFKQKLEATLGFVYAPFRMKDLVTSINLDKDESLDIEIYDDNTATKEFLLYDSNPNHETVINEFEYKTTLSMGYRNWLVKIKPHKDFFASSESSTHYAVLLLGIILVLASVILMYIYNYFEKKRLSYFEELKALSLRRDIVLKAATIGTWEWTYENNEIKWDKNMYDIYGIEDTYHSKELAQKWKDSIHKDYKSKVFKELYDAKDNQKELNITFWIKSTNGDEKYINSLGVIEYDKKNNPVRMIGFNHDITEHENAKLELIKQKDLLHDYVNLIEKISITDDLTKLSNRRHFNEVFPKYINNATRNNEVVCFAIMDVDNFKQYNDTYGHQKGDDVLIAIGKVLISSLNRSDDHSFRVGGEEFGILFKTKSVQSAKEYVDNIRISIENEKIEHINNTASKFVTASFGLICLNAKDIKNTESVYKAADVLLYKAKKSGRNKVVCNK